MKTRTRRRAFALVALLAALASPACGDGDGEVCFSPEGLPGYVGRTPSTAATLGGALGCAAPAQSTPTDPPGALCDDACLSIAECGGDFEGCITACEENPQCAEAFRCLRDAACEDQLGDCAEPLSSCQ